MDLENNEAHSNVFFDLICKLTCARGSEKGQCDCIGPMDCTGWQVPGWYEARENAKSKMIDSIRDVLDKLDDDGY
jgi:hypothetical protein